VVASRHKEQQRAVQNGVGFESGMMIGGAQGQTVYFTTPEHIRVMHNVRLSETGFRAESVWDWRRVYGCTLGGFTVSRKR